MITLGPKKKTIVSHCIMLCALLAWHQTATALDLGDGSASQANDQFQLVKSKHVAPEYPRRAVNDGREGWVDLAITVNPDGSILDVAVLAARPRRVFERPAIRAARKWEFEPPSDAGVDQTVTRTFRISFKLVN